jgi:predicted PurR-regulated permease PerM
MAETRKSRSSRSGGMLTRDHSKLFVVSAATIVCLYLCCQLARPFLTALVFAITVAVVTQPLMRRLERHVRSASVRAGIGEGIVTIVVLAPIVTMVYFVALHVAHAVQNRQAYLAGWQEFVGLTSFEFLYQVL